MGRIRDILDDEDDDSEMKVLLRIEQLLRDIIQLLEFKR